MLPFTRRLLCTAGLIGLSLSAGFTHAQSAKPITLVVPFAAGGPTDVVARTLAASMTKTSGVSVVVENKVGAGGTIAAAYVKNAAPDGNTVLIHHNGMSTAPALYRKLAFNPLTDFEYIGQVVDVPMSVVVRSDFPAKDIKELITYVKANKAKINLANAGLGAVSHLCGMMFQKALDADLTTVPFSGTGPAMTALLGGQVDLMCDQTTQTISHAKGGKVRLLAVTTKQRIKALPDVPTLAESGLKDFEVVVWHGIYAPKSTPKATVEKLNGMVRAALKDPEVQKKLAELGTENVSDYKLSPEGLQTWLKSEIAKYGPVIEAAKQFAD